MTIIITNNRIQDRPTAQTSVSIDFANGGSGVVTGSVNENGHKRSTRTPSTSAEKALPISPQRRNRKSNPRAIQPASIASRSVRPEGFAFEGAVPSLDTPSTFQMDSNRRSS